MVGLEQILKLFDINRKISREETQLLFYLREVLKRKRSMGSNNSIESCFLSERAEDGSILLRLGMKRDQGGWGWLYQILEGDPDVDCVIEGREGC